MKALTLIVSESEFLGSLQLERVREQYTAKGYTVEELSSEDPQAVLYALETQALFGDGRFVVVRGSAAPLEAVAERLAAWAAAPPPAIAAALVLTGAVKLRKVLAGRAELLEVTAPKPWEVADWLVRSVKSGGRVMTREAAQALVDAVGVDLRELTTAAEQLQTATRGSIGPEQVARIFRGVETQLYTFLDAVLQRDRSAALRHLAALLRAGEHPLVVHAALVKQFRALAAVRDARQQVPAALAKEIGVAPGYVNRAQKHGRNFDTAEIRRGFRLLADADFALKGGERGDDSPGELILELLVGQVTGERSPAPAGRRR